MGSFNEICALSNLPISYNDPVRLLFVTGNPYREDSDQKNARRGVYHHDQWFVRTPPLKGKYNDYGRCEIDAGQEQIIDLICKCFSQDIIERPFGFNQYHACDVTKSKGFNHYREAAWQGRLIVKDIFANPPVVPNHFPTWHDVHKILKDHKLPIQSESDKDEGKAGYNAQPVIHGVVCVTFNSYNSVTNKLKKAQEFLDRVYDTRLLSQFEDREGGKDQCLIVVPKGAYEDSTKLHDFEYYKIIINSHPQNRMFKYRELPVLNIMVREDVWETYCHLDFEKNMWDREKPTTVDAITEQIKVIVEKFKNKKDHYFTIISEMGFREVFHDVVGQTQVTKHITTAFDDENFTDWNQLIASCAELARIEVVMARTHQSWNIPSLGGQDNEWDLRVKLATAITEIAKKELNDEKQRCLGYNDDEPEET